MKHNENPRIGGGRYCTPSLTVINIEASQVLCGSLVVSGEQPDETQDL